MKISEYTVSERAMNVPLNISQKNYNMNLTIERIASIVAILMSLGAIFYPAVIVKRDVEILKIQSDNEKKRIEGVINKIQMIEKEIEVLKTKLTFINEKIDGIKYSLNPWHRTCPVLKSLGILNSKHPFWVQVKNRYF